MSIDWQTVVKSILDYGVTQKELAEKIGKSQPWVSMVKNGELKDVMHADGVAILDVLDGLRRRKRVRP